MITLCGIVPTEVIAQHAVDKAPRSYAGATRILLQGIYSYAAPCCAIVAKNAPQRGHPFRNDGIGLSFTWI